MTISRRSFLRRTGGLLLVPALPLIVVRKARGQTTQTFSGPMEQDAYRPVKLAPRKNAVASMTDAQRDDLEHSIKCQCGCPLDVYTCRTTDFSCAVSPAMHEDVMGLVSGGYGAKEILAAFQSVYGERVLMSPVKSGFNWLGYVLPSLAMAGGALFLAALLRRWRAQSPPAELAPVSAIPASEDELARLASAIGKDA